jgi:hypothetical protein
MPQLWPLPTNTFVNVCGVNTSVGTGIGDSVLPTPAAPVLFSPQHPALPVASRPHA